MTYRYAWTESIDDEIWRGGPCDSVNECAREALMEGYLPTSAFAIGIIEEYKVNYHDFADEIVYRLSEDAFNEVGAASEGWLDSLTKEDLEKLNCRVMEVIGQWLKEVNQVPSFYRVLPCGEHTVEEALRSGKDSPKGGKPR